MQRISSAIWLLGAASFGACGGQVSDAADEEPPSSSDSSQGSDDSPTSSGGADGVSTGGTSGTSTGGDAPTLGGASNVCPSNAARFVTAVVAHQFGTGQNFNQQSGFPSVLYGPPEAGDAHSVVSLGNGGWVVLEFSGNAIVDGPGADFIVFENPLPGFVELATVAVSDDLVNWTSFTCDAPQDATDYGQCAGVARVHSNSHNGIDPLDPAGAGGDAFDLAAVAVSHARYVRITDRPDLDGAAGVFDLDAVGIVNALCDDGAAE